MAKKKVKVKIKKRDTDVLDEAMKGHSKKRRENLERIHMFESRLKDDHSEDPEEEASLKKAIKADVKEANASNNKNRKLLKIRKKVKVKTKKKHVGPKRGQRSAR